MLVALADLVADLSSSVLKALVDRKRPAVHHLVGLPSSSSFPSGHAATSFACAVVLAVLVPRLAPLVLALAAAIAYSRLYLGVHYPSDVLAGAALGALVATALLWLAARLRPRLRAPTAG